MYFPPRLRPLLAASLVLFAIATPLLAQGHPGGGGDATPPTITFTPDGGTFYAPYAPSYVVRVGWCDDSSLNSNTRQVQLNGGAISIGFTSTTKSGCGAYGYSDASLTLQPGTNTVWAKICDSAANCTTKTSVYTYALTDVTPPTAQITPASGTVASASLYPVITWCDGNALDTVPTVTLNGSTVTGGFSFSRQSGTEGSGCNSMTVATKIGGPLTLQSGTNSLTAEIRDVAGNVGSGTATWTYRPMIDTSPTNQFSVEPQMADLMLSYSTPAYRSLDEDRAVTLVYSSARARPNAFVYVDVTDNSSQPADTMSIGLLWGGVFQTRYDGQTTTHYRTQAGTNRLGAFYSANNSPTRSMDMQAVVKRFWAGGSAEDTVPVRILVINEKDSPYGAGWTVAGVERVVTGNGGDPGIIVVHGGGSGTFYPPPAVCNAPAQPCVYGHSPGDFSTMVWDGSQGLYLRTSRDGTVSTFNAQGQLVSVHDRLNNSIVYAYANGRLSTITDPAGKVTTFAYDAAGKLASITDATGRVSTFVVNAAGDLVSITGPDQMVAMQMTYSTTHRPLSYTDRGGRVSNVTYDVFGRVATLQSPTFTAEGGQMFRLTTTLTSPEMAIEGGNINGGTHAAPFPRVDPATLRASVVDPQGRTTRFALDPWGAPSRVEDYVGYVSTTTRNVEGQVISTVDTKGNTISYTWSGGDLTRVASPAGTVNYGYDGFGHVSSVTGATAEIYNAWNASTGLLDYSVTAGTDTTAYTYDTRGRVLTASDAEHHVTTYDYTDLSPWMNTRYVTSGGRTTYYRYDTYGRVAGVTEPDGRETTYQYDALNRQRYVTTPDARATEFVWGPVFLDRINDPRGLAYTWTRNALGLVEREVRAGDPGTTNLTAAYDRYGRTTSTTNRRGQQVSVTYDAQDRVSSRTADGQTTTFNFSPDQPSNPTAPSWVAVSNPESTDTVRLDGQGRTTSAVSIRTLSGVPTQRYELQPRYDALSRPVGLVVLQPGGVRDSIGYSYDPQTFQLQSLRDMAGGVTGFSYTRDGLPWRTTLPNAQQITQSYTSTHALSGIRYDDLSVDNVAGVEYEYDLLNRIQSRISPNYSRAREYSYDPNGRWLSGYADYQQNGSTHPTCTPDPNNGTVCSDPAAVMTYTGGDTFTYDLSGNPTNHGAAVGAGNRLTQYDGFTLGYDLDGNLISKTKAGFSQTFTWNSLGQLSSATTNGVTVSYGYDGMGKRIRQRVNGVDVGYLYDGDNLLLEYSGNGVQAKYTYYPGEDRPHSVVRGGQTYYYATDSQESVLALFNSANAVVNQYTYLPFGEAQTTSETVANRIRYAGRELEGESGLYYNNARWYDPQLHRFISEDPIGIAGGLNLYGYTANNPVNFIDSSGLDFICYFYVGEWERTRIDSNGRLHREKFYTWDLIYCDKADANGGRGKPGATSHERSECTGSNVEAAHCWALLAAFLYLQNHPDETCRARGWAGWSRMLRGLTGFDPNPEITTGDSLSTAYSRNNGTTFYGPVIFLNPHETARAVAHEETHETGIWGHRRFGTYSGPPGTDPYEVGEHCSIRPAGDILLGVTIQTGAFPWSQ